MAQSNVTFVNSPSGLGKPLTGEDHVSGFVTFIGDANIPAGFATTSTATRVKLVYSLAEAEALGIAKGGTYTAGQWYHISEFFRVNPKGELYIGIFNTGTTDFEEIRTVQDYVGGRIRQFMVWKDATAFATSQLTAIQTITTALETDQKPCVVLYAADISATANVTSLGTLRALTAKHVATIIGEDGAAYGNSLAVSTTNSVTCLGAALGLLSSLKVNQSLGHGILGNVVTGTELDVAAFANLQLNNAVATSAKDTLDSYGYIFLRKFQGRSGTYFNFGHTAIATTSDYCTLENNRTIQKAKRGIYAYVSPLINTELYVDPKTGYIAEDTIDLFKNEAQKALNQMIVAGEITKGSKILINPKQNVLSTSKIVLTAQIIPVGVAKTIEVNIGYVVSIVS